METLKLTQQHLEEALRIHEPKKPVKAERARLADGRSMVIRVTLADGSTEQVRSERMTQCKFYYAGIFARQTSDWRDGKLVHDVRIHRHAGPQDTDFITRRPLGTVGADVCGQPLVITCIAVTGEPWADFFTAAEKRKMLEIMGKPADQLHDAQQASDPKPGDVVRFRASTRYRTGLVLRTTPSRVQVGFVLPSSKKCKHAWIPRAGVFSAKEVSLAS